MKIIHWPQKFFIWISDEPEVKIDGDQKQFIAKDNNVKLICRYNASPPVSEVQWLKDGKVIAKNSTATENGSRVTIIHYDESLSQLSITSASLNDSGNYICKVTNEVDSTSDSTSIAIQGRYYVMFKRLGVNLIFKVLQVAPFCLHPQQVWAEEKCYYIFLFLQGCIILKHPLTSHVVFLEEM